MECILKIKDQAKAEEMTDKIELKRLCYTISIKEHQGYEAYENQSSELSALRQRF